MTTSLLRSLQGSSTINSLPVELLSLIFTIGTHGTDDAEDTNRPFPFNTQSVRTPVIISQVNRRWRQIALNTPALWTSLCATLEMVETWEEYDSLGQPFRSTSLNTEHLTSYLALSRNYPLDILVDARDPDWDFFEPEISDDVSLNSYTPPFSLTHMSTVIAILVPHLHRWRSVSILTDSWAPMHVALTQINPHIISAGAPRLESLTLMRCNNFVSYAPQFQPADMKGPAFLQTENLEARNLFPRLQRLTLKGVHVDWNTLANSLSCSKNGLSMLDLSSHCLDVRPSPSEFHRILDASPNISELVISGSGPAVTVAVDEVMDADCLGLEPVKLSQLNQVSLGYRSALEGQTVLGLFDAPNVKTLTLEEVTYPGDPEEVNASSILAYIATGKGASEFDDNFTVTHSNRRSHHDVAVGTNDLVIKPIPAKDSKTTPRAAFPHLETALLKGVKSCPGPLHAFFHSVSNLQQLELVNMAIYDIYTLLPSISTSPTLPSCPCPQLEQLSIEGFDQLQSKDIEFIAGALGSVRQAHGACSLEDIDIHIAPCDTSSLMGVVSCDIAGTRVNIHEPPLSCNPKESFDHWDTDLEMDEANAFELGGAFNDPVFDAYYANSALAR